MSFELAHKKTVVVGLGLTGQSCVRFLLEQKADVVAMDSRKSLKHDFTIPVYLGKFDQKTLQSAELVVISPGVNPNHPAILAARASGAEIIGDVELFARFNQKPVIAITGSNGKSTVTALVTAILQEGGINAQMGGNIGTPVLELLEGDSDVLVLELSSFQLETVSSLQPVCAIILNISEDHLDRHLTLSAYAAAKQRIYRHAKRCIVNRDDSLTWKDKQLGEHHFGLSYSTQQYSWDNLAQAILFNGEAIIEASQCRLFGSHNILNIQAALACVAPFKIPLASIKSTLSTFSGLPHRFETISQYKKVRWINDSKATNVGATIAAIESLANRGSAKLILIAGGDGKSADFSVLQPLLLSQVDLLIALGKDGEHIASLKPGSVLVKNLKEAVAFADKLVKANDIVLLSPACASLDMFKNYEERGLVFKQEVEALAA